jgi:hypothetical protein
MTNDSQTAIVQIRRLSKTLPKVIDTAFYYY